MEQEEYLTFGALIIFTREVTFITQSISSTSLGKKTRQMSTDNTNESAWIVGISPPKTRQGYLLSGFLALVGLSFIFCFDNESVDAAMIGYLQLGFAALVLAMAYRTSAQSKELLVIDNTGIWYRDWRIPVIPWAMISRASVAGSRIKASLDITIENPDQLLARLPENERKTFTRNTLVKLPAISIPDGAVSASLQDILVEIEKHSG